MLSVIAFERSSGQRNHSILFAHNSLPVHQWSINRCSFALLSVCQHSKTPRQLHQKEWNLSPFLQRSEIYVFSFRSGVPEMNWLCLLKGPHVDVGIDHQQYPRGFGRNNPTSMHPWFLPSDTVSVSHASPVSDFLMFLKWLFWTSSSPHALISDAEQDLW